ncbi:Isoflavone 4'-O-methyltransferase [Glycine soja]
MQKKLEPKWVLHDWKDELSMKILKNCKEAISGKEKEGKVIIIDITIDEVGDDREMTELKLDYNLVMLTMFNGKERVGETNLRGRIQQLQNYSYTWIQISH